MCAEPEVVRFVGERSSQSVRAGLAAPNHHRARSGQRRALIKRAKVKALTCPTCQPSQSL